MSRVALDAQGRLKGATQEAITLVKTEASRYAEAVAALTRALTEEAHGVFLTANRPVHVLRESLKAAGTPLERLVFVDCVSAMTGIMPPKEEGVVHIESPTMLEKAALRAEQCLRRMEGPRFLLVDSLSTLSVYNGNQAVSEMTHTLVTRLRVQRIGAALMLVDRQAGEGLEETILPLCDGKLQL